jgi:hypothetical protein
MIARFKNHIVGSNLGPDHVIKQAIVEEISLKRIHAREILLIPLLQKSTSLFIRHGLPIVGHRYNTPHLIILFKIILLPALALLFPSLAAFHLPHDCTGLRMSWMESLPRKMSIGKYRRFSRHKGHSVMNHEEGMVWTGAGIDSLQPLQKTQKSCIRDDGGRLSTNPSIGE